MLTLTSFGKDQLNLSLGLKVSDGLIVKYFVDKVYVGKTFENPHSLSVEREFERIDSLLVHYQIWQNRTMLVESSPVDTTVQAIARPFLAGGHHSHSHSHSDDKNSGVSKDSSKTAIIVGISDYKSINDLSYCDEDATDWFSYFFSKGYQIKVFGDNHPKNYPAYNGLATEKNVRAAFRQALQNAKSTDTVALITSGHGSGDGQGNSYLCMYDCKSGTDEGSYRDKELLSDLQTGTNRPKVFIFIDNCYSGGMLDELQGLSNVTALTTCTKNGYGYDDAKHENGAWTYCFLQKGLIEQFKGSAPVNQVFAWAKANYASVSGNAGAGDQPQAVLNLGPDFQL